MFSGGSHDHQGASFATIFGPDAQGGHNPHLARVDGASAVFSGTAVVSNKLAAVPVVITGMELAKQTPDSFPKLAQERVAAAVASYREA